MKSTIQVGGQAVVGGVMMRAPGMVATAVRRANGEITVKQEPHESVGEKYRFLRLPVMRGAVGLVEMMVIGIRTLNFSAEMAMLDAEGLEGAPEKAEGGRKGGPGSWKDSARIGVMVVFALAAGVGIFFLVPLMMTTVLLRIDQDPVLFNLVAGAIRMSFLICYLFALTRIAEIRRLFQYHGAEHMAVFAFESGGPLDVGAAAGQSRFHPRCGTSFLLIVMIVSVALFGMLDALLMHVLGHLTVGTRILTHLPLVPLVGGVSYELIRASARHSTSLIGRIVVAPGLWLQNITTREPDAGQLEVALVALRAALGRECALLSPVTLAA